MQNGMQKGGLLLIIHDYSTTISCSRCSGEYTISGKNYSERTMRRIAKKFGWLIENNEDICPACVQRDRIKAITPDGHFTVSQLLSFQSAAIAAQNNMESLSDGFICPVCGATAKIRSFIGIGAYTAECPGCGISFQKK